MSIITRAWDKLKNNDDSIESKESKSSLDDMDDMARTRFENIIAEETIHNLLSSDAKENIDIPVNENLNEVHGVTNLSHYKSKSLDIDLNSEVDENAMFVKTQVLSINPAKSFSNHIELDLSKLNEAGFITPDHAGTILSNTFRMIKRPLIKNVAGRGATVLDNANLIMVTSSLDGEGKSYSAINLAISLAMEKNKNVLLIDADVNKPSHHKVFGQKMENGLTDLLIGKVKDMSRILYKTNIPSLSLMFAGNHTTHATELLASDAMEDFVREISTRYPDRIVVFDSPPLLLTTESSAMAYHMGQIVLVVEAERTLKHTVKSSLELLSNEIVLLLLNKVRENYEVGYGYYGYGHQS